MYKPTSIPCSRQRGVAAATPPPVAAAGGAYAAACRARAHYHEIEQYGTFARSVALLTRRAAATLEQEARASSFRDAALAAHEAAGRATQAWRDAARSFPPPSPSVK